MKKNEERLKDFGDGLGDIHLTGAIVCRGPQKELSQFFSEIARLRPETVRVVYQKYSPGKLLIKIESEE